MSTVYNVLAEILLPLDKFLASDSVQEIMINDYRNIFVEEGGILKKTGIVIDPEMMVAAMNLLAKAVNEELSSQNPILEARLEDGSRVAGAVFPVVENPCLSIRKFSNINPSIYDYGLDEGLIGILKNLIVSKKNFLIGGGTSSGKTTFFNALLKEADFEERIIIIEDTKELKLDAPNLIRLEAKKDAKVSMRDLLKLSLRLRPDKLILGEVRDAAAFDLCQAFNTGHSGGSTIHANSARQSLTRLETLVLTANTGWELAAIRSFIANSIDILVFLEKVKGKRRIKEISKLEGIDDKGYSLKNIYIHEDINDYMNYFN